MKTGGGGRGTNIGYVEVQNMLASLQRNHDVLRQDFDDSIADIPENDGGPSTELSYFCGVVVFATLQTLATNPAASPANKVHGYEFILPFSFTVTTITIEVTTARNASSVGVGLYDGDGDLVLQSGAILGTIGYHHITLPDTVDLTPGRYFFAQTTDDILLAMRCFQFDTNFENFLNSTQAAAAASLRWGTSNQAPAAPGVLPATLGTLSANINNRPIVATLFENI